MVFNPWAVVCTPMPLMFSLCLENQHLSLLWQNSGEHQSEDIAGPEALDSPHHSLHPRKKGMIPCQYSIWKYQRTVSGQREVCERAYLTGFWWSRDKLFDEEWAVWNKQNNQCWLQSTFLTIAQLLWNQSLLLWHDLETRRFFFSLKMFHH